MVHTRAQLKRAHETSNKIRRANATLFPNTNPDVDCHILQNFLPVAPLFDSCECSTNKQRRAAECLKNHDVICTMRLVCRSWRDVIDTNKSTPRPQKKASNNNNRGVLDFVALRRRGADTQTVCALLNKHGDKLVGLDVGYGGLVHTPALRKIAEKCPNLTSLEIERCAAINDHILEEISLRCPLKHLVIEHCMTPSSKGLDHLARNTNTKLESLNVRDCQLGDDLLLSLANYCPNLRSLNAVYCNLSDKGVVELANKCRLLDTLSIGGSVDVTDKAILALAESCTNLRKIFMWGCVNITDAAVQAIVMQCPKLEGLDIEECPNLTDDAFYTVSARCSGLRSLHMANCKNITDRGIKALASRCTRLTTLELEHCSVLTDDGVCTLVKTCPELTSINARGCFLLTDESVFAVARFCPQLTDLHIAECGQMTEQSVCEVIKRCTKLESLNIGECTNVCADEVAETIRRHAVNLTGIFLWDTNITDEGVAAIATSCASKLVEIDLQECIFVTSECVLSLAACHKLHSLNIALCTSITDAALQALLPHTPNLLELDVEGLLVTDTTLRVLAKHCHHVVSLNLRECVMLTDRGVDELCKLESLSSVFLDCPFVTTDALFVLKSALPSLVLRADQD